MEEVWQNFHFFRPYFLIGLIIPFIMVWYLYKNDRIKSSWADICDEHLLKFLLIKGQNKQRKIPFILAIAIVFTLITAIAGPSWKKKENPAIGINNPVMIILSMSTDMQETDVSPDRMSRAKYVIKDVLKTFQTTETGLIVYTSEPFVITPLAEDPALIDNILPAIEMNIMPENGDRLDRAIDLAVDRLQEQSYTSGNIIVLTSDVGERFEAALDSAEKAQKSGIDVNIIKISDEDNDKLPMIANKGHGIYLDYRQDMSKLSDKINDIFNKQLKESRNKQSVWEDMGYYFLWLPALLLLFYFRQGLLTVIIALMIISPASAGIFLNNNQEAMRYFANGNYDKAAQKFEDIKWKGAAAYKNGDFTSAYESFSQGSDTTSLYNQGNALAKAGKIDEAIKKYEEVLAQDDNFEDARFNLEYLKKQQKNQQREDQKQQQSNKQNNKQDKQNQQNKSSADQNNSSENQKENNEQDNSTEQQQQENQDQQENQQDKKQNNKNSEQQQDSSSQQQEEDSQQEQNNQNEQQQHSSEQSASQQQDQQGQEQKSSSSENQQQDKGDSTSDGSEKQSQSGNNKGENDNPDLETNAEKLSRYGNEDQNSEHEAEALQTQAGNKLNQDQEKIRARLQKFREIPEDKGGLLKAFIRKEYQKNRYKDE